MGARSVASSIIRWLGKDPDKCGFGRGKTASRIEGRVTNGIPPTEMDAKNCAGKLCTQFPGCAKRGAISEIVTSLKCSE